MSVQSKSSTFGRRASARAMATRCCCPPVKLAGICACLFSQTHAGEKIARLDLGMFFRNAANCDRRFNDVFKCGEMGERLKLWNTMPTSTRRFKCPFLSAIKRVAFLPITDQLAIDRDEAIIDPLQMVDRAQQRRLTRTNWPRIVVNTAGGNGKADIVKTFSVPKDLETPWMLTEPPRLPDGNGQRVPATVCSVFAIAGSAASGAVLRGRKVANDRGEG